MSWETVIPPLTHQSIHHVPNVCNICNGQHYTGLCSSLSEQHIPDRPYHDNLSRYSVPDGLLIVDCESPTSPIVVTAQKFAKGTRFGPMLAPKSYSPPTNSEKFPLIIFNEVWNSDPILDELGDEIKELFNVRNLYLDTSDEHQCNWMIHVEIAKNYEEQNLMAYQENDQIYYTSTRDIELGDILKVWYSPSYALRMGVGLLERSDNTKEVEMNFYGRTGIDYGIKLPNENMNSDTSNNYTIRVSKNMSSTSSSSEITLPPINSLMKTPSPIYNRFLDFEHFIPQKDEVMNGISFIYETNLNDQNKLVSSSESENNQPSTIVNSYAKTIKFTEMHETETQKFSCETCGRKYITKSNLEKHMRSHDLFMCIICMKMFENPEELRSHECFKQKTSAKKSLLHCSICWKVLSNAWSLNRHMKIHRSNQISGSIDNIDKSNEMGEDYFSPNISTGFNESESEEQQMQENTFHMAQDTSKQNAEFIEKSQFEVCFNRSNITEFNEKSVDLEYENDISSQSVHTDSSLLLESHQYDGTMLKQQDNHHKKNGTSAQMSEQKKKMLHGRYDKCVVCARTFKNPNSLDKHLKNVHTVHIIKPELTTSIKKSSEYRRIVLNKKPIKENVAKALMSKLNKKNLEQQQKMAQEQVSNMEPKINIQDARKNCVDKEEIEINNNSNKNNNNTIIIISNVEISPASASPVLQNFSQISNHSIDSLIPKLIPIHCAQEEVSRELLDGSPKMFIIDKTSDHQAAANEGVSKITIQSEEEQHHCPDCDKVFPKKYQLKRHQDIHENLFYFCPYCSRAPVKARSSLRKHLAKDHPEHHKTWQTSSFLSTLLRKYEKVKNSSQNGHDNPKKCRGEQKEKKEKRPYKKRNRPHPSVIESNENISCFITKDEPLPQGSNSLDIDDTNQNQQILLNNLFLDPITMDEENNLIKYSLGDDDFMSSAHNGGMITNGMNHACLIENYEISEFSSFKSSFDEIQEKLDAELEFNNDRIKWNDELNDDDSTISSPCGSNLSSPETTGKSVFKHN